LIHGNASQHLHVLEGIFRQLRLLFLATRPSHSYQADCQRGRRTADRSPRSEFHVPSLFAEFAELRPADLIARMRDFLQLSIVLDESPAKFFATPVRHYTLGSPYAQSATRK
jgi:hypothetical protein